MLGLVVLGETRFCLILQREGQAPSWWWQHSVPTWLLLHLDFWLLWLSPFPLSFPILFPTSCWFWKLHFVFRGKKLKCPFYPCLTELHVFANKDPSHSDFEIEFARKDISWLLQCKLSIENGENPVGRASLSNQRKDKVRENYLVALLRF